MSFGQKRFNTSVIKGNLKGDVFDMKRKLLMKAHAKYKNDYEKIKSEYFPYLSVSKIKGAIESFQNSKWTIDDDIHFLTKLNETKWVTNNSTYQLFGLKKSLNVLVCRKYLYQSSLLLTRDAISLS